MSKIAETFVNLGLLKSEFVTTEAEPAELEAFGKVSSGEQAEILMGAEQVIVAGVARVHQAARTVQDRQQAA